MNKIVCRMLICCLAVLLAVKGRAQQTDTLTVYFEYNQSNVNTQAEAVLEKYFAAVAAPLFIQQVTLSGYCDPVGASMYNDSLSMARVKAVKTYLLDKWIDPTVVSHEQGFGEEQPVNNNSTPALMAANRRVVITVLKVKLERPTLRTIADTVKPTNNVSQQPQSPSLSEKIMDTATKAGSTIVLENIIFYGGRHFPMPASQQAMNELLNVMITNPQLEIEIDGYVCCEPDSADGFDADTKEHNLSVQRAKYMYDFLRKNGIHKNRMRYAGFGASHKLYPHERDLHEQTLNRRVEIKIIHR